MANQSPGSSCKFWGVRYQVRDVDRSVSFYTQQLGFTLKHQQESMFAKVACGELDLFLSGPGSSGARNMPDGRAQEPGGWTRIVLRVDLCVRAGLLPHSRRLSYWSAPAVPGSAEFHDP